MVVVTTGRSIRGGMSSEIEMVVVWTGMESEVEIPAETVVAVMVDRNRIEAIKKRRIILSWVEGQGETVKTRRDLSRC